MPPIQSTTSATSPAASGAGQSAAAGALGKDDFLKLLVGQLRHQDPMNPTGDQDFIGQMAQFSMLEQLSNLAQATQELTQSTSVAQTVGLLGRTVTYAGADGTPITGTVDGVDLAAGGSATLTVGGQAGIDPAAVSRVR
jgi:flagellar basal-body rod modification protein FlgD